MKPARFKGADNARRRWPLQLCLAVVVVLAVLVVVAGLHFWRRSMAVQPPVVATAGLDHAVAELIQESSDEVRASPRSGPAWGKLGLVLQTYDFQTEAQFCFAQAERFDPGEPRWPWFHGLLLLPDDADAAIARLRQAVELCRDQPDAPRLRLAQLLAERGQWDDAERNFQALLRLRVEHAPALLGLANVSYARGHLDESTALLKRCLGSVHTGRSAATLLATVQRRLGDASAAETTARLAATLPTDQPWPDPYAEEAKRYNVGKQALIDRAQTLLQQRRAEVAAPLVAQVVKQYPAAADAWLLQGRLRLLQKDYADAEQSLREQLRLAPDSVDGWTQLGLALLHQGRNGEAAPCFQNAVQRKPDFAEGHYNLGLARSRDGRRTEAMEALRDAIRCKPDAVEAYLALADVLNKSGRPDEAATQLRRALELNPADARAKQKLERLGQSR